MKCSKCGIEKELDCFNKRINPSGAPVKRGVCKACRYAKRNVERIKKAQKRFRDKDREAWNAYHQKWRDENRDKVHKAQKRYYDSHTLQMICKARKREADELQAMPVWADQKKIKIIYAVARWLDKNCIHGGKYHVDHVVPLKGKNVCGLHVHNNLQILEAGENMKKHNKW